MYIPPILAETHFTRQLVELISSTLVDWVLKHLRLATLVGISATITAVIGLAGKFRKKKNASKRTVQLASKTSQPSPDVLPRSWGRNAFPYAVATLLCVVAATAGWAMMAVDGKIRGEATVCAFALAVLLPNEPPAGLVNAEIHMADQGGNFSLRLLPGTHKYLFLKHAENALFSSVAVRTKGWMPASEEFLLNPTKAPFVGSVVDRFLFDSRALPENGGRILSTLRTRQQDSEQWFIVVGHADKAGAKSYNESLGKYRAVAAAEYLVSCGIPRNHIIVCSLGADCPVDRSGVAGGDELDRRIEVFAIANPYVVPAAKELSKPKRK